MLNRYSFYKNGKNKNAFYSILFITLTLISSIIFTLQQSSAIDYTGSVQLPNGDISTPPETKRNYLNIYFNISTLKNSSEKYGPLVLYKYSIDDNTKNTNNATPIEIKEVSAKDGLAQLTGQEISDISTDPTKYKICTADFTKCSNVTKQADVSSGTNYIATISIPENESAKYLTSAISNPTKSSCNIDYGIGWIICPVVKFLAYIADSSFGFLAGSFLQTNTGIFTTEINGANPTSSAWSTMRKLANVAFVIVFLIIIFSQISSYGISNYGIKKMLPRLVVAAILVNISYYICQIAVDISNIAGYSLKDLLSGLVSTKDVTASAGSQSGTFAAITATILGASAITIALYGASLALLIPVLVAAVIALIMILFILVARQAIIIMLIVLSPLAFVAFLLPNTQGLFDKWKKTFTAMLMLFPVIAVVFGTSTLASNILASVFSNTETTGAVLGQMIASAVLVVPLFIVPGLLKKSLDAIPMLGQMASGLSSRANSSLGNKLSTAYKSGDFAKGMEARNQLKEKYRNREYAKRLGTSVMTRTLAGGLSPIMPGEKAKYINRSIEGAALSAANKAETDDISERQLVLRSQILAGKTTSAQAFKDSVARNDSIGARAAMSIQLESGGGRDKAHGLIKEATVNETFTSTGGLSKLQGHIASTNPSLSDKDVVLGNWSHAGGDISTIEKDAGTFNVTDTNMAAQSYSNLLLAAASGQMTKEQATRIINTPSLTVGLKPTERMAIENVSKGMPINNNIDENGKIIKQADQTSGSSNKYTYDEAGDEKSDSGFYTGGRR